MPPHRTTPPPLPCPHPTASRRNFFSTLWAEYRGVFAEEYMNVGGDEIDVGCWTNDTEITAWMAAKGTTDINVVIAYYYTTMMGVLKAAGWKPMFWMVRSGGLGLGLRQCRNLLVTAPRAQPTALPLTSRTPLPPRVLSSPTRRRRSAC